MTLLQADLTITSNAKLLQIYGESLFSTILDNHRMYLLNSTNISKYNVIAYFEEDKSCTICNRDKADSFVDWSHIHFKKKGRIEELPEEQIKAYLKEYLQEDLNSLLRFTMADNSTMKAVLEEKADKQQLPKVYEALDKLGVLNTPAIIAASMQVIDWAMEKQYYRLSYNFDKQTWYVNNSGEKENYGKGYTGSWRTLLKSDSINVFFEKTDHRQISETDLDLQINLDLQSSSYTAANKFIKIEDSLTKAISSVIQQLTSTYGIFNTSNVVFPDVEVYANEIAKGITKYKRLVKVAEDTEELKKQKSELIESLKQNYTKAYDNLNSSQASLKSLCETYNISVK